MKTIDGVETPLREWTFLEILEYCNSFRLHSASGYCECSCPLYEKFCSKSRAFYWDLSEKKKFTEQEIEDAKTIKRILGDGRLYRDKNSHAISWRSSVEDKFLYLNPKSFPSIKSSEQFNLLEITGDADA